ncbi:non-ribosomal peptide synthetase [Actinoallomurus rhizosphaericola]|uniref:non-ribosomal peptide synthetase n=1 Tax=Actinoallomurus rhizosphaericola TaxID=2952536 RepID=UPI002092D7CC|nr:non-ribosomal peptide synthetase [Actinoallomurus rhizosphaericola]MCO5997985.1 non-ribosomal peptide synthetase [Actinoallomurus rhizosphaericola]
MTAQTLTEAFAAQVKSGPDRPAVTSTDEEVTYRDLDARSDALSARLRQANVRPGDVVALSTQRGVDMIVALLAVLKSGAAYLPIDPSVPRTRLDQLVERSGAVLILTDGRSAAGSGPEVMLIDAGSVDPIATPADTVPATADSLAYIIYTSGTTGEPKGVRVTHRNVLALLAQMETVVDITDSDVWTVFHSLAFDFSVWEIWGALTHGCRLVVVEDDVARSPSAFISLLRNERVSVLNQTPSAFLPLMRADAVDPAGLPDLRLVILGGERVSLPTLADWLRRHGDEHPRMINMYGVTECTVFSSYRPLTKRDLSRPTVSPIGAPLPGNEFLVLDANGRPVGDDEEGELFVLGPTLSAGYVGGTDESADRFAPLDAAGGRRAYRTGDLVLRRPDGDHLYIGRNDRQLKVRGYRVDPNEIERHLSMLEQVGAAVVTARDYGDGDVRLVAHLVPPPGQAADADWQARITAEARATLARALPASLCPSVYEALDALPLTVSGKADLTALAAGEPPTPPPSTSPPDDTPVARITEIWERLLNVKKIDVDDDFFDLGGTSLTVTKMFDEVRKTFGYPIDIQVLMDGFTIAVLSKAVEAAGVESYDDERSSRKAVEP